MTEAFPTNFHTFHVRKVLTPQESPADFREVTPAERARIEAEDAKWEKPDKCFIDLYDEAFKVGNKVYGKYDPQNAPDNLHPFNAYDLWLTYEEAIKTMLAGTDEGMGTKGKFYHNNEVRAVLPFNQFPIGVSEQTFEGSSLLETVWANTFVKMNTFMRCPRLKTIASPIIRVLSSEVFQKCPALENITFALDNWSQSFSLADSPNLTLATMQSIPKGSGVRSSTLSVTVHPTVYAKLTDEENTEWHAVMTAAAQKNISFITI